MKLFCSLKIKGIENVKNIRGNVIIASNHIGEIDPVLISACLPFFSRHLPLYFVSREKDFYKDKKNWRSFLYGGTFFRLMGAYPAYVGLKNYHQALRHHLAIIREGNDVVIFPMGKVYFQDDPTRARGGATFLARETNTPIIPVSIRGIEGLTFSDFICRKRKLTVTFGEALNASDLFENIGTAVVDENRNDYEKASSRLVEKIIQLT